MEQFAAVATAHFLALLIPGVDFFLIARTAMTGGWRNATGTCLGIATANGIFIGAAFSGLALISDPIALAAMQVAGGAFLLWIGVVFMRSSPRVTSKREPRAAPTSWAKNVGLGLVSGLLNPKNALFYLSLAAALAGAPPATLVAYGVWMVAVVAVWDVFVAVALGSRRALARLERLVPWLTKAAGAVLTLFGVAMIVTGGRALVAWV